MALVQALSFDDLGLTIKFEKLVKVSSLVNSAFSLIDSHNQIIIFKPIDQYDDFNSISRTLILYFADETLPAETYTFTVSGVLDAANVVFPDYTITFTAGEATPTTITEPIPDPIIIVDKSIRSEVFMTSETIFASNSQFYITETDPPDSDLYVPTDYNSGRVVIRFSSRPDGSTLNTRYFRVQRKLIQRMPARWENVDVKISLDADFPWVYIDFPSTDASPTYTTVGATYFVTGYKYRIILSKDIGT